LGDVAQFLDRIDPLLCSDTQLGAVAASMRKCGERNAHSCSRLTSLALQAIDRNSRSRTLGLKVVAKELKISRCHLAHVFKRDSGYSVEEYIRKVRARQAVDLLLNTGLYVKEIAFDVGFGSVVELERAFKKLYGATPSDYRDSLRATYGVASRRRTSRLLAADRQMGDF
jgi:AraC-like DNA-binding protein